MAALADVTLVDEYMRASGRSRKGIQARVRLPMLQRRRDLAPQANHVCMQPGINEGARCDGVFSTAVWQRASSGAQRRPVETWQRSRHC